MPKRSGKRRIEIIAALLCAFTGCDPFRNLRCTCDDVLYFNVCVQGKYDTADSVAYLRERGNGKVDSLAPGSRDCFEELSGKQRILVFKKGVRIDSSAWFTLRTVDCCHGEGKIVVF